MRRRRHRPAPSREGPELAARGRTCVGCRRLRPGNEMVRFVRTAGDAVALDAAGTAPGRGAYVCPEPECFGRARRRLVGALRAKHIDSAEIERDFLERTSARV